MKHLIALSMKYIRRQKMRTFLTFMCITLSAFILTTICTYGSSLYTTLFNYTAHDDGLWELDISSWVDKSADRSKAIDIITQHAVVDDYAYTSSDFAMFQSSELGDRQGYFEVNDGKNTYRFAYADDEKCMGNSKLVPQYDEGLMTMFKLDTSKEGVFLPSTFKTNGYSEGDTIELTVRPVTAVIDMDSDIVKDARKELKETYGTEYFKGEEGYEKLTKEEKNNTFQGNLYSFLSYELHMNLDDMPFTDNEYGEPVTYKMKIAGFLPDNTMRFNSNALSIFNSENSNIRLSELAEKNPQLKYSENTLMRIRLIDTCDYDEALKMLFTDLGYDYDTQFLDEFEYHHEENTLLLALETKSPYAMFQMLPFLVPVLIVLLIGWFISRFVIDNTFEMAVQERSTHFAAMRIMGASKTQIAFVVLNEALFYCLTAVPLGMILAVVMARICFDSLRNSGLEFFEFSAKPAFIAVAAFLTVIALFISAYTSAMWASRKLSPAEALNFGKPRSKRRKIRRRKSKLNLSANKFLRRYTRKNIRTAKSRFIIATITMALGVLMFTFTALIGMSFYSEFREYLHSADEIRDFDISGFVNTAPDVFTEPDKYFSDKNIFSGYTINGTAIRDLKETDGSATIVQNKLNRTKTKYPYVWLYAMGENEYKKYELDTITGMSYEEFCKKDGFIYNNSIYGEYPTYDTDTHKPIEYYERDYIDLKKGFTISDLYGGSYQVIGKVSSAVMDNAIIIPLEKTTEYNFTFDIELTVNGRKQYEEAQARVNDFMDNCICGSVMNLYISGTGFKTFIGAIIKIIVSFLISIWLVGILSMINSVNTSVLNRSRELMMLRSVGMSRKQLRKSVILETIMFSTTAAITGTILGVGGYIFFLMLNGELGHENNLLTKHIAVIPVVVILSLVINIIISLIAAIPAIRNLNRVESIAQAANS